jgi:isocitrate dehydrogenase
VFDEISKEYTDIENEHWIVDIGTARLADTPEIFDVIVVPNLYGDVISDVAAQIAGSVGLAGSANIGEECAMFEAIHGSAPLIAGQGVANPSGLIQGAVMMLNHIGQKDVAAKIQNAWLKTIEDGVHTFDIYTDGTSTRKVNTEEFTDAVIANLGNLPERLPVANFDDVSEIKLPGYVRRTNVNKELRGVDVFVDWNGKEPDVLADALQKIQGEDMRLSMITNRGIKVWPYGFKETFCTDHWRCRFESVQEGVPVDKKRIIEILAAAEENSIDTIKTENLYAFDGEPAFSLGQGQ